jgi:cobalt-zinc-cadmium resistance protein CzcA
MNNKALKSIGIVLLLTSSYSFGQDHVQLELSELKSIAIRNNAGLKSGEKSIKATERLEGSSFTFDKTELYNSYDENNIATNGRANFKFGIQQTFAFPTVYGKALSLNQSRTELSRRQFEFQRARLFQSITQQYYYLTFLENRKSLLGSLDSLYSDFARKAERKYELGGSSNLEKITALSKQRKIQTDYQSIENELTQAYEEMRSLIQSDTLFVVGSTSVPKLSQEIVDSLYGIGKKVMSSSVMVKQNEYQLEKNKVLPDLSLNYAVGTNSGLNDYLHSYQVGIRIPLLFFGDRARIQARKLQIEAKNYEQSHYEYKLTSYKKQLEAQLANYTSQIIYYESEGLELAKEITRVASKSYDEGEIDFFKYIQSLETAKMIQLEYLSLLNGYNQSIIQLNYLLL